MQVVEILPCERQRLAYHSALVADDLVTQGAKAPAHTIFAENILFSTSGPFY